MKSMGCKGQKSQGRTLNMKRKPAITIRMSAAIGALPSTSPTLDLGAICPMDPRGELMDGAGTSGPPLRSLVA
jgi:hypothetical protein